MVSSANMSFIFIIFFMADILICQRRKSTGEINLWLRSITWSSKPLSSEVIKITSNNTGKTTMSSDEHVVLRHTYIKNSLESHLTGLLTLIFWHHLYSVPITNHSSPLRERGSESTLAPISGAPGHAQQQLHISISHSSLELTEQPTGWSIKVLQHDKQLNRVVNCKQLDK